MAVKAKLKRAGWIFLAVLFVATGLGIGVWGFIDAIRSGDDQPASNDSISDVQCSSDPSIGELVGAQAPLKGKKLPNFTPVENVTTLQCIDVVIGDGMAASPSSNVTANYTGAVAASGDVFESSLDSGQPITIPLSQVIPGWTQGMEGMKAGGTRRLVIPAALAYGSNPPQGSGIPAGAALVFDITLINVQ